MKDLIETYRKLHNITLQQLADEVGVSKTTIHSWEKGDSIPSHTNLRRLASAMGIDYTEAIRKAHEERRIKEDEQKNQSEENRETGHRELA